MSELKFFTGLIIYMVSIFKRNIYIYYILYTYIIPTHKLFTIQLQIYIYIGRYSLLHLSDIFIEIKSEYSCGTIRWKYTYLSNIIFPT
jgi:hypothetical protein